MQWPWFVGGLYSRTKGPLATVRKTAEEADLTLFGCTMDHTPRSTALMDHQHTGNRRRRDSVLERTDQRECQAALGLVAEHAWHLVPRVFRQPPEASPLA